MATTTRKNSNPLRSLNVDYFASGSNHAGEIDGLASIGHSIGVAVNELNDEAIEALKATAGAVPVFVDSGAFSEVEFPGGVPTVVKPITSSEWTRRLELYQELAEALGAALMVVAPDQVAFPGETLGRLSRYRKQVQAIAATGAKVLVPLQGKNKVGFWRRAQLALNMTEADGLVPAFPCKKNATTPVEIQAFVAAVRPKAVHCLGMGSRNKAALGLCQALRELDQDLAITLDSNLIRANVGRSGDKARAYTAAQDEVRAAATERGESLPVRMVKASGIRGAFLPMTGQLQLGVC
jgi:hypothetical protein